MKHRNDASCAVFSGSQCAQRESPGPFANGSTRTSISIAGWRVFWERGSKGRGINVCPTAKFGMGLWAVVAGAFAWHKHSSPQGVTNRFFVGGNAGSAKTSPSSVRNSDVWIRGPIIVGPHLGQSPRVNTSPVTDFPMRFLAVVWRPTVGVEFPGLQSTDDDPSLDGNAGVEKAAASPYGKTIGKMTGFHLSCCCRHAFIDFEDRRVRCDSHC